MQRPRSWVLLAVLALASVTLLAAHEDDAAEGHATASAAKTVQIKNFAFKPGTLTVGQGARVAFVNASGVPHTASGSGFDTRRIAPGKSATVKFGRRGTFAYHCKIHPYMKGKVIVE
jgi:plastocyanin